MSESGENYDPGPWKGYDFKSARKAYDPDVTAGRGYGGSYTSGGAAGGAAGASKPRATSADILPPKVTTDAASPLVILVDGTGSMGQFPETIFEKLPLLDDGVKDYLGDDCEISYAMIGDIGDVNAPPLQVRPFGRGKQMVDSLNKLVIGRGGGSNMTESYELGALYYARNAEMPKATKPVLIFICDEGVYPTVDKEWAKTYAGVELKEEMSAKELFDELKRKFSVYCVRKHYEDGKFLDGEKMCGNNLKIQRQWVGLLGEDRIAVLTEARRIVDVILGILAVETGKEDFFEKEIKERQTDDQVKSVMKTMVTVGKGHTKVDKTSGKSLTKRPDHAKTKVSKKLVDE